MRRQGMGVEACIKSNVECDTNTYWQYPSYIPCQSTLIFVILIGTKYSEVSID